MRLLLQPMIISSGYGNEVRNKVVFISLRIFFQIESLEQQIKGDKKFLDEQATEREGEREEFNRRIELLEEVLKRKEKEEDKEISLMTSKQVGR